MNWDFKQIGNEVKLFDKSVFLKPENISLSDNIQIDDFVFFNGGKNTVVEHNVHIATFVSIVGGGELHIGCFSGIAAGCRMITGSDDYSGDYLAGPTIPPEYTNVMRGKITLESHVLLGTNVVIMPDVTIGEGSVIYSGAIVVEDIEPWGIYAGAYKPKRIRDRNKYKVLSHEYDYYKKYNYLNRKSYKDRIESVKHIVENRS